MKRILYVIDDLEVGGMEMLLFRLLARLDRKRYDPRVVTLFGGGPLADKIRSLGVPVDVLGRGRRSLPWAFPRLVRAARGRDVVHAARIASRALGTFAARIAGAGSVVLEWGGVAETASRVWLRLERLAARRASRLAAYSGYVAGEIARRHGIPRERFDVIYNGVELPRERTARDEARRRLGLPPGAPVAGIVANLNWRKDYPTFLRAARLVLRSVPGALFVSAGEGPESPRLEALSRELGLGEAMRFLGSRPDVQRILPAFDVFVLSSATEGFPVAAVEAMAAGLPCVLSEAGGNGEVVERDATGFLFPAGDAEGLAEAVLRLLRDPALAAEMGRRGRERVESFLTIEKYAERVTALYES